MQQSDSEHNDQASKPPEQAQTSKRVIPTHFKYLCRICQKEILQPVLQDSPEKTPEPYCCSGSRRDMAFKGVVTPQQNSIGSAT